MAHTSSNHIHQLIRSMNRSEKRFFKIHLRTHSSKHSDSYMDLFDRISQQDEYEEASLIKEFKSSGQRYPVMKHRLFEKVLDALEVFHRGHDPILALRTELNRAQVLMSRGLYAQADQLIEGVILKAAELDLPELILEAKRLQLVFLGPDLKGSGQDSKTLTDWSVEMDALISQVKDEWDLCHKRAIVFRQMETVSRGPETSDIEGLASYANHMTEKGPRCRFIWHHGMAALAFMHGNAHETLEHTNACVRLLEEHGFMTKDHKVSLAKMVANGFYSAYRSHDLDQAEEFMVRLKIMYKEEAESPEYPEFLALYLQSKLFMENHSHSYFDAEHMREMEQRFLEICEALSTQVRAGLDYGFALFNHGVHDSSAALKALNRILHAADVSRDDEVYARALIYSNVIHIETDDREWLLHSARTLKRYLQSRDRMGATESALLRYIADIRRSRSVDGEAKALARYTESLRTVRRLPMERISFEYFDFLRWAEERSSLNRRSPRMVA